MICENISNCAEFLIDLPIYIKSFILVSLVEIKRFLTTKFLLKYDFNEKIVLNFSISIFFLIINYR